MPKEYIIVEGETPDQLMQNVNALIGYRGFELAGGVSVVQVSNFDAERGISARYGYYQALVGDKEI